jgi:hypothetical protein
MLHLCANRFLADYEHSPSAHHAVRYKALASLLYYAPRLVRSHIALKQLVQNCSLLLDAELNATPFTPYLINTPIPEGIPNR